MALRYTNEKSAVVYVVHSLPRFGWRIVEVEKELDEYLNIHLLNRNEAMDDLSGKKRKTCLGGCSPFWKAVREMAVFKKLENSFMLHA
jgi:hypothetical protein